MIILLGTLVAAISVATNLVEADCVPKPVPVVRNIFVTKEPGYIESEGYPVGYLPCVAVTWILKSEDSIHLKLHDLILEDSQTCQYDSLTLYEGDRLKQIGKLCGVRKGLYYQTTENVMTIDFEADQSGEMAGFRLEYFSGGKCSEIETDIKEVFLKKTGGTIVIPYTSCIHAQRSLVAPPGGKIRLLVGSLFIENATNCKYDNLTLYDGNSDLNKLNTLCGELSQQEVYFSSDRKMLVSFQTDSSVNYSDIFLEYIVDLGEECNTTLVDMQGTVSSPNFPGNYTDGTVCWTLIKSYDLTKKIVLNLDVIHLEESRDCIYDYIEIYDGVSRNSPLLGRFCKMPPETTILSSSPAVLIYFHSDYQTNNTGFSFTYSIIDEFTPIKNKDANNACFWAMDKLNGTISSPTTPIPTEECVFELEAPANQKISLTVEKISIYYQDRCKDYFLEVWSVDPKKTTLLAKFCGQPSDVHKTITSLSNKMRVKYRIVDTFFTWVRYWRNELPHFLARYRVVGHEHVDAKSEVESKPHPWTVVNIVLSKGQRHVLSCPSLQFNSNVNVTWMKDAIPITSLGEQSVFPDLVLLKNQSLVINDMSWNLEGMYTCTFTKNFKLQVYSFEISYNPTVEETYCDIKFNVVPKSTVLYEWSYFYLRCSTVNPETDIKWQKDNWQWLIEDNPRFRMILPGLILINPVLEEDTGNYTCLAKNHRGCYARARASITVHNKPQDECGIAYLQNKEKKSGKLVGGDIAKIGFYPWQAMLVHKKEGLLCGGSVIHRRWVVTAAHCVKDLSETLGYPVTPEDLTIKLGKHDVLASEPFEQVFNVTDIKSYPDYDKNTFDNDIALIQLDHEIIYDEYIQPICIESKHFMDQNIFSKKSYGMVTGWGRVTQRGRKSQFLREVLLPVVEPRNCLASVRDDQEITDNMFCAGYAEEMAGDACQGDSGGPFAVEIDNRWYLVGIVSWGEGCAKKGKYGFYTKAGNYYDWIVNNVK